VAFAFLPFVLVFAADVPAVIQPASLAVEQAESANPNDEIDRLFDQYNDQIFALQFDKALTTAKQIKPDPENRDGTAIVFAMRASALLGLKRDKEAAKLIAEADRLAPQEPFVSQTLFIGGLLTDRTDVAADALDRLIARAPDQVHGIDRKTLSYFLRNEPKGQEVRNEDRRIALARLGYGGDADYGDYFTASAVEILVKRGDVAGASELLAYVDEPQIIENWLIQKRYAALWPKLEALAGPHLQKVRAASVGVAERAYAKAPDDHEKLQLLANALRHAGRLDEAIALKSKLPASSEAMFLADEQIGWAVNNVALAMHEAGRPDDADQLFALLNDARLKDEDGSWRVSMKINRLELLVSDGKFERALPLVEPTAQVPGSPYAKQLVRRLRYCTMSGLGRKEEAAKLLPDLLKYAEDALGPTIDGLICAGQMDEAERLALASLTKDTFHESFVRQLQASPLTSDDPSIWTKGWLELRRRPAIAAEFNRLGRDMPVSLLPPAKPE